MSKLAPLTGGKCFSLLVLKLVLAEIDFKQMLPFSFEVLEGSRSQLIAKET